MHKSLKFNSKETKLLFTSDWHEKHVPKSWGPLSKGRGFDSIDDHDNWIHAQWAKLVDENTFVFNLGDIVFSDADSKRFDYLSTLYCKKHYLLNGNHLSGMRQAYFRKVQEMGIAENTEVYPLQYNNITFVGTSLHLFIDGISVYLQHYPQYVWPEMSGGGFCLAGHCHGNAKELNPTSGIDSVGKILDVGIDNSIKYNGTPFFTWEDIKAIMSKKSVISHDHH